MGESYGHQCQFCVDSVAPIDTSSIPIIFDSFKDNTQYDITDENGITGSRSHKKERVREGAGKVGFELGLSFTPTSMAFFLEYLLGGSPSGTSYTLAETLPSFVACLDKKAKVITYTGLKIDKAVITASKQSPMIKASLSVMGTGYSVGSAGTFPSLTMPTDPPYQFWDAALTLQSVARQMSDFTLTIDNMLEENLSNDQIATELNPRDRIVTLKTTNPFNSTEIALFEQAIAGAAGSLVLTNGNYSTTFDFANLKGKRVHPSIGGKTQRIPLDLETQAFQSGSTKELVVTHDSTP